MVILGHIIISSCQKNNELDNDPDPVTPVSLLEVTKVLNSAEGKFIEFGKPTGTTPQEALRLTSEWLRKQSNISKASIVDDAFIDIKLKSGLPAVLFLDITDEDGISINRGGGSDESTVKLSEALKSKYTIENKKVLLCYPNLEEFYKEAEVKKFVTHLQGSEVGLDVTMKDFRAVNPALIQTFGDYGLVIINTHGFKDCFLSGSELQFYGDETVSEAKEYVINVLGQKSFDDLSAGLLRMGTHIRTTSGPDWINKYVLRYGGFTIWIGSEYIRSLPDMPNTIIFSNFCYSGQTNPTKEYPDPIGAAFKSKKLITYYSYDDGKGDAYRATNSFAKAMEDSVTKALLFDIDSTGNSHLSFKGDEFKDPYYSGYLKQYGAMDYSYKSCVDVFTDKRDGIIYKAVCIGKQNWMAENLRYNAPGSVFYDDNPANGPIYGKLYSWDIMMNGQAASKKVPSGVRGICPEGWHVPSEKEYNEMVTFLGGDEVAGGAIKNIDGWQNPNIGATNISGFSALPAGYRWNSSFRKIGTNAYFWTSSESATPPIQGRFVALLHDLPNIYLLPDQKDVWMSCRCVKDK